VAARITLPASQLGLRDASGNSLRAQIFRGLEKGVLNRFAEALLGAEYRLHGAAPACLPKQNSSARQDAVALEGV